MFPSQPMYKLGYKFAFFLGDDLKFLLYSILYDQMKSKCIEEFLLPYTQAFEGFTLSIDTREHHNAEMSYMHDEILEMSRGILLPGLLHKLTQELMSPLINATAVSTAWGQPSHQNLF